MNNLPNGLNCFGSRGSLVRIQSPRPYNSLISQYLHDRTKGRTSAPETNLCSICACIRSSECIDDNRVLTQPADDSEHPAGVRDRSDLLEGRCATPMRSGPISFRPLFMLSSASGPESRSIPGLPTENQRTVFARIPWIEYPGSSFLLSVILGRVKHVSLGSLLPSFPCCRGLDLGSETGLEGPLTS